MLDSVAFYFQISNFGTVFAGGGGGGGGRLYCNTVFKSWCCIQSRNFMIDFFYFEGRT